MQNKTYRIVANRTPQDVLKNNDITLETGLTLEEARIASLEYQRQGHHVAVWIEEEETAPVPTPAGETTICGGGDGQDPLRRPQDVAVRVPTITRSIERDVVTGRRVRATYCDGWAI